MKINLKSFAVLTFVIMFLSSCLKAPNHSVRVRNQVGAALVNIVIGDASFGRVESGATSEYRPLKEGDFTISGNSTNGGTLGGKGNVKGRGTHNWTVTIPATGQITFLEDK